jgi:hypothetical protein
MDGWTILTTKNIVVNSFNTQIIESLPMQERVFLWVNLVEMEED